MEARSGRVFWGHKERRDRKEKTMKLYGAPAGSCPEYSFCSIVKGCEWSLRRSRGRITPARPQALESAQPNRVAQRPYSFSRSLHPDENNLLEK